MRHRIPIPARRVPRGLLLALGAATSFLAVGCSSGLVPGGMPSADDLSSLEAHVREQPNDADARVRLGAAYLQMDRAADARRTVEPLAGRDGGAVHPAALVVLGGALEAEERYAEAREAYQRYLLVSDNGRQRDRVEARLAVVRRRELEADVRAGLQREAELADEPSDPAAVAVFPFLYDGTDEQYRPLGRALAEMIVTDLARVDRVRVLERLRVQLLLDEMQLAEEGRADPATAARSGRILGAGRVVQGRIGGDTDVVSVLAGLVATDEASELASVDDTDAVAAFFDLQKRLVLSLFDRMGVQLSPAEREQVLDRPTENLQALLLYGRGLEAQDQGDFPRAAELFEEAAEEDPEFEEATTRAAISTGMGQIASIPSPTFAIETLADLSPEPTEATGLEEIRASVRAIEYLVPGPEGRDPSTELLGTEGVGGGTVLDILLRRPR